MNNNMKKILLGAIVLIPFCNIDLKAQNSEDAKFRPILTAVPSLRIAPDAQGAALGDQGVATMPDTYSTYWNASKLSFMDSAAGISLSYTPWLKQLVNDIALMYVGGYYQFKDDSKQAIGASISYFTLGKIQQYDAMGMNFGEISPNEYSLDITYSRKLSPDFSMAVSLRYIRSDQGSNKEVPPGNAFAADISGYMHKYVVLGSSECLWTAGFNIKNIGTKISLDGGATRNFIPTNLSIGSGLLYPIDNYNMIGFTLEANKLLVPMKPINTGDNDAYDDNLKKYNDMSPIAGIFKSFYDAPDGFSEEFKEIRWSLGLEYNYDHRFFVRAGYSYLDPSKGNLQYFTAGAGFKMSAIRVDASYLISTVPQNPLDQTLRFSMSFDMDGITNLFK